jgi:glutamate synthase domain-containing protein 1
MGNYAPQSYGLHHPEYPQSDNPSSNHSSYNYPPKQSSLEETLKEFMQLIDQPTIPMLQELSLEDTLEVFRQTINQSMHEIKDATMVNSQSMHEIKDAAMANTEAIARLEG